MTEDRFAKMFLAGLALIGSPVVVGLWNVLIAIGMMLAGNALALGAILVPLYWEQGPSVAPSRLSQRTHMH